MKREVVISRKGIYLQGRYRGVAAHWHDLLHPEGIRTQRFFFGQLWEGIKTFIGVNISTTNAE